MKTRQQKETLKYFREYADDWREKAKAISEDEVNIIKQRNNYVMNIISERKDTKLVLDIGCGPGDLIIEIAKKGIKGIGIDFAKEMINLAKKNTKKNLHNTVQFECYSVFDYHFEENKYDVISANGFIEYISYKELNELLKIANVALKPNGSLVLSSRNRLFNIFSLNKFTKQEINGKKISGLLSEAMQIAKISDIKELIGKKTVPLQKFKTQHHLTGINVKTRYQFTPIQLINMLKDKGFEPIDIYPIHIHGVMPEFKNKYPAVHAYVSNLLQNYAKSNMSMVPLASSFMVHVRKR